jgi:ribosomal protein S18 acetylase RimI-like enzyme
MRLRAYVPKDWDRLCAIHDAARKDELRAAGLAEAFLTLEQTAENEGLFNGELVVAEIDGEVQGFVAFAAGELTWLYVSPQTYRKGIGRQLLRYAVAASGGRLSAEVLVGNQPALSLYLSEGFHLLGRTNGRLAGNERYAASAFVLERKTFPTARRRAGRA